MGLVSPQKNAGGALDPSYLYQKTSNKHGPIRVLHIFFRLSLRLLHNWEFVPLLLLLLMPQSVLSSLDDCLLFWEKAEALNNGIFKTLGVVLIKYRMSGHHRSDYDSRGGSCELLLWDGSVHPLF